MKLVESGNDRLLLKMLGHRVKMARVELALSQAELGKRLGMDQNAVSKIELGKVDIRATTLARLAQVLHKAADWFYQPVPALLAAHEAKSEYGTKPPKAKSKRDAKKEPARS